MSGSRGRPPPIPGIAAEDQDQIVFEDFSGGINTLVPRSGIADNELVICDGFMPLGDTLVTLPGTGSVIYTATGGTTVVFFCWFSLGTTPYVFVLLSNGAIWQVTTGGAATQIAPAGTIVSPTTFIGIAQWGSEYLIFCADQPNGYWLWDGTLLYTAGTLGPTVTIADGGMGYTAAPIVTIHTSGPGTGAAASATVENNTVTEINLTNAGHGYGNGDYVWATLSGGNGGAQAQATSTISNGVITGVTLTNGGAGYQSSSGVQSPPTVTVTDATGTGASIVVAEMIGGQVISLKIGAGGSGYTNPTLSFSGGGTGSGAAGTVSVSQGVVTGITVTAAGAGYTTAPAISFLDNDGTGATAVAVLGQGASAGTVVGVTLLSGGQNYSNNTVIFTGGGNATASVVLMPFGISGTSLETFAQRVWIGNGAAAANQNRLLFSAPGDPSDFNPADGAGATPSLDSFLRIGYYALRQTNGFLYLLGDSSINYVSGVQTSTQQPSGGASQTISTFNNQNADPQIGTPWPGSVQVFSRNVVFANPTGVYVSYGGAATRISQALDGLFGNHVGPPAADNYPSAVTTLSLPDTQNVGSTIYMLLLPVVDQVSGQTVNKLLMWDGKKWWTSQQDRTLSWIATKEFQGEISSWGTDGTNIFRMLFTPTTGFTKTAQSKLFSGRGYTVEKTAIRLHAMIDDPNAGDTINVTIDNEAEAGSGNAAQAISTTAGLAVLGPYPIGQAGRLLGFTLSTTAAGLTVLSVRAATQDYTDNT